MAGMKIKLVVVDVEIPIKVKKWGIRIGVPAAVLLVGSGIAWAAGLKTWASGDALTAADLNGNFQYLQAQISPSTFAPRAPSAVHAGISANATANNNAAVVFDAKKLDLGNELQTNGTIKVTNAGVYLLDCELAFQNPTTGVDYAAELYKNSTGISGSNSNSTSIGNNYFTTQAITTVQLAAGDVVSCYPYISNSSAATIYPGNDSDQTHLSVTRLY